MLPLQIILVTNTYNTQNGKRIGVRTMTNGVKIYYMHSPPMVDQVVFPSYYATFPLFRNILIRERIEIVHGHAATSVLMHECILQAKAMGYKVSDAMGERCARTGCFERPMVADASRCGLPDRAKVVCKLEGFLRL